VARWAGWTAAATALGAGLVWVLGRTSGSVGPVWPTVVAVLAVTALASLPVAALLRREKPGDV
jgi:hypothetical protein